MDLLSTAWKLLLLRGVMGVLFGILAIAWPIETVIGLAVLWGIWALVDGVGLFVAAFRPEGSGGQRLLAGLMAAIAVLAGLYAIVHPGSAAVALTWVIGIWLLVRGVFEVVGAFAVGQTGSSRWMGVLSGLVDFLLGGILVAHPGKSAVGITWLLGIIALVWGIVLIVLALVVRSQLRDLADEGGVTPSPA
jgi:uncharacterized membrane protein HdeD (DUF308 family)